MGRSDLGNSQMSKNTIRMQSDVFFEAFDALPSKVRLYLDEAPYPTNPVEVLKLIRAGVDPGRIIVMLKRAFKDAVPIECDFVYGPISAPGTHHPQAKQ